MALKNPYCGHPAYAGAANPKDCVKPPCEVATSANTEDPTVEEPEPDVPERPDCVALVYASNEAEVLQEFTYDEDNDQYNAPNGDTMIWDTALGWLIQTGNGTYFPQNAEDTSPFGLFCTSGDEAVSTVPCDKAVFPEPEPEPVVLMDCVRTKFADDEDYILGEFNLDNGAYIADDPNQGVLAYDEQWTITVGGVVYTGSEDQASTTGLYFDPDGNCILVAECV